MQAHGPRGGHIGQKIAVRGVKQIVQPVQHEIDWLMNVDPVGRAQNVDHVKGAAFGLAIPIPTDHKSSVGEEARPEPSALILPASTVSPNSMVNQ